MDEWRLVAYNRINKAISRLSAGLEEGTAGVIQVCPVCRCMNEEIGIVRAIPYKDTCVLKNNEPCPAEKSCKIFIEIVDDYPVTYDVETKIKTLKIFVVFTGSWRPHGWPAFWLGGCRVLTADIVRPDKLCMQ